MTSEATPRNDYTHLQQLQKSFHRRDKLVEHEVHCQGNFLKRKRDEDDSGPATKKVRDDVQTGEDKPENHVEEENDNPCSSTTAFEGSLKKLELKPRKNQKQDMSRFVRGKTKSIFNHLSKELIEKRGIKWSICVKARFVRPKPGGENVTTEAHFRSSCMRTVDQHELYNQLEEAKQAATQAMVLFQKEGSGWVLDEILHLDLSIAPVKGSRYIPLPSKLKRRKLSSTSRILMLSVSCGPSLQVFTQRNRLQKDCTIINSFKMNLTFRVLSFLLLLTRLINLRSRTTSQSINLVLKTCSFPYISQRNTLIPMSIYCYTLRNN